MPVRVIRLVGRLCLLALLSIVDGSAEVDGVTFTLDSKKLVELPEAPFEIILDAAGLPDGCQELVAVANLVEDTQLDATAAFEVQPGQPAGIAEIPAGEAQITGTLPGWGLPAGIVSVLVLVGLGLAGLSLVRRKPRVRIVSGAAVASGRTEGASDLPMDMVSGEKFATLAVLESLTLRRGQAFDLSGDVVTIGRGADSRVIVPDAPVSRNHAEIRREGITFRVFDLGSASGTFVNDARVAGDGLPIQDGDLLRLATQTLMVFTVILPQITGPEDKTFDMAIETLAGLADVDEGGIILLAIENPAGKGETVPPGMIIPKGTRSDTEQLGDGYDEEKEQLGETSDDTIQLDAGEEDAELRS